VARRDARDDLAALVVPLGRRLLDAEAPVLERNGLTMWAYVVLSALADAGAPTQAALAESIGADKTRIIAVLDDLQDRGLIDRRADPDDRRARILSLTPAGRRTRAAAQAQIQRGEERWLGGLTEAERTTFLAVLAKLAAV
jgi:DNA-binding MarR family transcriptional regulator